MQKIVINRLASFAGVSGVPASSGAWTQEALQEMDLGV